MQDLLVDPWRKLTQTHPAPPYLIIIDALDEIEGEGGSSFLWDLLNTVNSGHLRGLKFLITSRPDPNLAELCASFKSEAVCHLYDVPANTVNRDITTYLQAKLPALPKPLVSELAKRADGLFIYAATAVRYICPRRKMSKIEQVDLMEELLTSKVANKTEPFLIDELYQKILLSEFQGLGETQSKRCLDLLHTLLCTVEQVSVSIDCWTACFGIGRLQWNSSADGSPCRSLYQGWPSTLVSCIIPRLHVRLVTFKLWETESARQ